MILMTKKIIMKKKTMIDTNDDEDEKYIANI